MRENGSLGEDDRQDSGTSAMANPAGALLDQASRITNLVSGIPATVLSYISPTQVTELVPSTASPSVSSVTSEGPRARRLLDSVPSGIKRAPVAPFAFSFAPAGLLFPYHLGVAMYLQHIGYLTPHTPLMGASAGALVVACIALELDPAEVWKMLYHLENDFTLNGTRGRMRRQVRQGLERILPEDAHMRLNKRPRPAYVIYTAVKGTTLKPRFCGSFGSKRDLINCLLASCNIPMYFTNHPFLSVRQDWAVDGYFCDVRNFGCPPFAPHTPVRRQVRVLPFEASRILASTDCEPGRSFPDGDGLPRLDYIAPDLNCYDHLLSDIEVAKFVQYVTTHRACTPESVGETRVIDPSRHSAEGPAVDHPLYACGDPFDKILRKPKSLSAKPTGSTRHSSSAEFASSRVELPSVEPLVSAGTSSRLVRRASEPDPSNQLDDSDLSEDEKVASEAQPEFLVGSERLERLASIRARKSYEAALQAEFRGNAAIIEAHDNAVDSPEDDEEAPTAAAEFNFFYPPFTSPKSLWASLTARLLGTQDLSHAAMRLEQVLPLQPWGLMTKKRATVGPPPPSGGPEELSLRRELPFCRFSWGRLLQLALRPATESRVVVELFELGRADAFRWHQLLLRNNAALEQNIEHNDDG